MADSTEEDTVEGVSGFGESFLCCKLRNAVEQSHKSQSFDVAELEDREAGKLSREGLA